VAVGKVGGRAAVGHACAWAARGPRSTRASCNKKKKVGGGVAVGKRAGQCVGTTHISKLRS